MKGKWKGNIDSSNEVRYKGRETGEREKKIEKKIAVKMKRREIEDGREGKEKEKELEEEFRQ